MKSTLGSPNESLHWRFFAKWGIRQWSTWPLLPLLGLGQLSCIAFSAAADEWSVALGWLVASLFGLVGSFLQYWAQAPVKQPIYQSGRRRAYVFGVASAFAFRWILLGVSLFVAVFSSELLSIPATAACILIPPLLYVGTSLALHLVEQARRKKSV